MEKSFGINSSSSKKLRANQLIEMFPFHDLSPVLILPTAA